MKFRRFRPINMGDFYLPPPEPEPTPERPPETDETGHWIKKDPKTGRYAKATKKSRKRHTKRYKAKARNKLRRELAEDRTGRTPSRTTCYSATCIDCGKVWLAVTKPIAMNAIRDGRKAYVCAFCSGSLQRR
jgi:hypothetical protein